MLEAIEDCERIAGRELEWTLSDDNRIGDHRWWISDLRAVRARLPGLADHLRRARRSSRDPRRRRRKLGSRVVKLSVVIPAHNEVDSIAETVERTALELERNEIDYEIVVVDDASSDGTGDRVRELSSGGRMCAVCDRRLPPGFGYAVRAGLAEYTGDAVAIMMADLSDSPKDLVLYYRVLEQGMTVRSEHGSETAGGPMTTRKLKLVLNRIVNAGIRLLFQHGYNDTTNAFKAYRARGDRTGLSRSCPTTST